MIDVIIKFPTNFFLLQNHPNVGGGGGSSGSNSLGHSSASPHNSMEGSPRMVPASPLAATAADRKSKTPAPLNSGVSLNKKTIRNYTPRESGDLLRRQLEDNRRKQVKKIKHDKTCDLLFQPIILNLQVARRASSGNSRLSRQEEVEEDEEEEDEEEDASDASGRKTSVERMIEDFHRNLPPPSAASTVAAKRNAAARAGASSGANTAATTASSKSRGNGRRAAGGGGGRAAAADLGTMSSRVSNWSEASFDYQVTNFGGFFYLT